MMTKTTSLPHSSDDRPDETTIRLNDSCATQIRSKDIRAKRRFGKFKFQAAYAINALFMTAVVVFIVLEEYGIMPAVKQPFKCRDESISFKYEGDTIRPLVLAIISQIVPLLIFLMVEYVNYEGCWRKIGFLMWRWNKYMVIGNVFVNLFIIEMLKSVAGELRPHFLDTCAPDAAFDCKPGQWIEKYTCTNKGNSMQIITDSSRSFPSGHAAVSVFTSVFCAAYILARFNTRKWTPVVKPIFMAAVLVWGPACGITRITDHRHHWWDVLIGSIIGVLCALYAILVLASKFRFDMKMQWDISENTKTSNSTANLFDIKNKNSVSINV